MILLQSFVDLGLTFPSDEEAHSFISSAKHHGEWYAIGDVASVTSLGAYVDLDEDLSDYFHGPDVQVYLYHLRYTEWEDDGEEDQHGYPRGTRVVERQRAMSVEYRREE